MQNNWPTKAENHPGMCSIKSGLEIGVMLEGKDYEQAANAINKFDSLVKFCEEMVNAEYVGGHSVARANEWKAKLDSMR